jgi:hypothetical protein
MQLAVYLVVEIMLGLPISEVGLAVVLPQQRLICDAIEAAREEGNGLESVFGREILQDLMDEFVGERVEGGHDDKRTKEARAVVEAGREQEDEEEEERWERGTGIRWYSYQRLWQIDIDRIRRITITMVHGVYIRGVGDQSPSSMEQ